MDQVTKKRKVVEWEHAQKRYVAMKIAYIGLRYDGFAVQENTENTVEGLLLEALKKAMMIKDIQSCGYSRCGRTDKGVSALGNAFSLYLRSREGHPLGEYDYMAILNKLLPDDIKIVGYCFPDESFDARFSCLYREYKYFFCLEDMDFRKLVDSVGLFRGEHDFRNFCKMDIVNVSNFRRRILSAKVEKLTDAGPMSMCVLTLRGFAFLWHQVRCMAAVLFLIGRGKEEPALISQLLDVQSNPQKPTYDLASETSLLLFDCGFESVEFRCDPRNLSCCYDGFCETFMRNACVNAMYRTILGHLDRTMLTSGQLLSDYRGSEEARGKKGENHSAYTPLMSRPKIDTYDTRVSSLTGKKAERKAKKTLGK